MLNRYASLVVTFILLGGATASAADWGSIKGKFIVDGSVGNPAAINVTTDAATCGNHNLVDESVVVGEDGALQNAVVYIYTRKALDVHPDYEAAAKEPVVLDNKSCRFEPHVLAVRTGQGLQIANSDPVGHNTNAAFAVNPQFNQIITSGTPVTINLAKAEPLPVPVACNIHPWMKGYLVVREDPYVAISSDKGEFEIKNVPAGTHEFVFWHEAKGNMRDLALKGGKTDRRGRAKLKIAANETLDLGEIKVPKAALGK